MVHFASPGARLAETEETKELARDVERRGRPRDRRARSFVGRFGARAHVDEGETVEVAVDTSALHFFDPETGLGIYDQANEKGATS